MIFRRIFGKDEYFLENKTQKAIIVKFLKIDWLDYSKIKYFILSKYTNKWVEKVDNRMKKAFAVHIYLTKNLCLGILKTNKKTTENQIRDIN